jgi:aspartate 1-decarboxylase
MGDQIIMLSFNFLNDPFINSLHPPLMNDEGDNPMAQMRFPSSISFLFFTLVDFKPVKGTRRQ